MRYDSNKKISILIIFDDDEYKHSFIVKKIDPASIVSPKHFPNSAILSILAAKSSKVRTTAKPALFKLWHARFGHLEIKTLTYISMLINVIIIDNQALIKSVINSNII